MLLDGGVGTPHKILLAYMDEAALPTDPPEHIWFLVAVMLLWHHDDQLKSGLPWMEIPSNHWLPTNGRIPNACVGGFGDPTTCLVVRGMGN